MRISETGALLLERTVGRQGQQTQPDHSWFPDSAQLISRRAPLHTGELPRVSNWVDKTIISAAIRNRFGYYSFICRLFIHLLGANGRDGRTGAWTILCRFKWDGLSWTELDCTGLEFGNGLARDGTGTGAGTGLDWTGFEARLGVPGVLPTRCHA